MGKVWPILPSEPSEGQKRVIDVKGCNIFVGIPTHRDFPPQTTISLLETQDAFVRQGLPYSIIIKHGSSLVHHARIKMAAEFLQSDCTHMLWIDSDMVWTGTDALRLVALGTQMECVGGLYTAKQDPPSIAIDPEAGTVEANEYGCIPVKGMGLGFTIMQRKLIEELSAQAPKRWFPHVECAVPYIFRLDDADGERAMGEDMSLFRDIKQLGYQVWADPAITLGHVGQKEYRADPRQFLTPA